MNCHSRLFSWLAPCPCARCQILSHRLFLRRIPTNNSLYTCLNAMSSVFFCQDSSLRRMCRNCAESHANALRTAAGAKERAGGDRRRREAEGAHE